MSGSKGVLENMILKKKLANNFTYYINNNKIYNKAFIITIVAKVGSAYESKSGMAHLLEHMLMCFYKYGKYPKTIKNISAHTDYFETTYTIECSNNIRELVYTIEYVADVIKGKYMEEKYFYRVKFDVLNEIKDSAKYQGYQREVFSILFENSDYMKKRAIGDMRVVEEITYSELRNFFGLWYSSDRMAVIISGDFESKIDEVEKSIEEYYSLFPQGGKKEIFQYFELPQYNTYDKIFNVSLGMSERSIESIDAYFKVENRYPNAYQWMKNCVLELIVFHMLEAQMTQFFNKLHIQINKVHCELVELDNRYSYYLLNLEFPRDNVISDYFMYELGNEIKGMIEQKGSYDFTMLIVSDLLDYERNEEDYYLYIGNKKIISDCVQNFIYDKPLLSYKEKCDLYEQILTEIDYAAIDEFYTLHFSKKEVVYIIS